MAKSRDIYQKAERTPDAPPPAGGPSAPPPSMKPPHTRAIIVLALMILAMVVIAVIFSLQHPEDEGEFDYLLQKPAEATNVAAPREVRTVSTSPGLESLLTDLGSSTQRPPSSISPQRMAEAMSYIRSGQQYLRDRDMDAAEREVLKALDIWPDMNMAIRMMGSIYTQRGQFDRAIVLLEHSLAKEPFSPETLNNLAINYLQKGQMEKAEELLLTALEIRPDYTAAYLNLGFLHLRTARYDLASENFQIGLDRAPNNPGVINNLAVCLIRLGDIEGARRRLQEVIEMDPNRAMSYFNMAISYVLEQNEPAALEWIRRGADRCTPSQLQTYLSDADFDTIRDQPGFQQIVRERFPEIPTRVPRK